jgi:hypothetical protein
MVPGIMVCLCTRLPVRLQGKLDFLRRGMLPRHAVSAKLMLAYAYAVICECFYSFLYPPHLRYHCSKLTPGFIECLECIGCMFAGQLGLSCGAVPRAQGQQARSVPQQRNIQHPHECVPGARQAANGEGAELLSSHYITLRPC